MWWGQDSGQYFIGYRPNRHPATEEVVQWLAQKWSKGLSRIPRSCRYPAVELVLFIEQVDARRTSRYRRCHGLLWWIQVLGWRVIAGKVKTRWRPLVDKSLCAQADWLPPSGGHTTEPAVSVLVIQFEVPIKFKVSLISLSSQKVRCGTSCSSWKWKVYFVYVFFSSSSVLKSQRLSVPEGSKIFLQRLL